MHDRRTPGDDLDRIERLIDALDKKLPNAPAELADLQTEIQGLYGRRVEATIEAIEINHDGLPFRVTLLTNAEPNFKDTYRLIRVGIKEPNPS